MSKKNSSDLITGVRSPAEENEVLAALITAAQDEGKTVDIREDGSIHIVSESNGLSLSTRIK